MKNTWIDFIRDRLQSPWAYVVVFVSFALFLWLTEERDVRHVSSQDADSSEVAETSETDADLAAEKYLEPPQIYAHIGPRDPNNVTPEDVEDMWQRRIEAANKFWSRKRTTAKINDPSPAREGLPKPRAKIPIQYDYFDPIVGRVAAIEDTAKAYGLTVDEYLKQAEASKAK